MVGLLWGMFGRAERCIGLVGQGDGKIVLKIIMLRKEYNVKIGLKNFIVYISWNLRLENQSRLKFVLRCVLAKMDKDVIFLVKPRTVIAVFIVI